MTERENCSLECFLFLNMFPMMKIDIHEWIALINFSFSMVDENRITAMTKHIVRL